MPFGSLTSDLSSQMVLLFKTKSYAVVSASFFSVQQLKGNSSHRATLALSNLWSNVLNSPKTCSKMKQRESQDLKKASGRRLIGDYSILTISYLKVNSRGSLG